MMNMSESTCVACGAPISEGRMICSDCEYSVSDFNTSKVVIKLSKFKDIPSFMYLMSKCPDDVVIKSGHYAVNAKSIMGLFSLDLSKPHTIEFYGDVPAEVKEGIKRFIA